MKEIYEEQSYTDIGSGIWETDEYHIKKVDIALEKLYDVNEELKKFKSHIGTMSRKSTS